MFIPVKKRVCQVLQVMCSASECSHASNEIEGLYNRIIITVVLRYAGKYHSFVTVAIVTCAAYSYWSLM